MKDTSKFSDDFLKQRTKPLWFAFAKIGDSNFPVDLIRNMALVYKSQQITLAGLIGIHSPYRNVLTTKELFFTATHNYCSMTHLIINGRVIVTLNHVINEKEVGDQITSFYLHRGVDINHPRLCETLPEKFFYTLEFEDCDYLCLHLNTHKWPNLSPQYAHYHYINLDSTFISSLSSINNNLLYPSTELVSSNFSTNETVITYGDSVVINNAEPVRQRPMYGKDIKIYTNLLGDYTFSGSGYFVIIRNHPPFV
tara:strand:+ start:1448 stop:2206 length:759 start_codon:yes stop_codon:yes gene_type:complete